MLHKKFKFFKIKFYTIYFILKNQDIIFKKTIIYDFLAFKKEFFYNIFFYFFK